jgi:predicted nucleic acid-binding Zn ribbon protein
MDAEEFLQRRVKWQPKPYGRKAENVGQTVSRLMDQQIAPNCKKLMPVLELWKQMLPADIQKHCKIAGLKGRQLEVTTDSSSYAYELKLCSQELVSQIQQNCPAAKVEKIKIIIGS